MEDIRTEKDKKALEECTFQPNLRRKSAPKLTPLNLKQLSSAENVRAGWYAKKSTSR